MMSMMDLLDELRTKIKDVAWAAWAWDMPHMTSAWGTVSADGAHGDHAQGTQEDTAISGTIDLYTRTAIADLIERMEIVLTGSHMAWRFGDILYDRDARAIHLVWDWETVEGIGDENEGN